MADGSASPDAPAELTLTDVQATADDSTVSLNGAASHECLAYYGLHAAPFRASVDPKLLWLGKRQQDVLATLTSAIRDGSGIFVVTSDIGTGKTSLTHSLIDRLKDDDVLIGRVTNPGFDISDFFQAVAHAYRLRGIFETKDAFVLELQQRLSSDGAQAKKVLLIIDEAQSLTAELLREIRDLSIIGDAQGQSLAILLVGQNDLAATLAEEGQAALRQRITLKCTLDPLTPHEIGEYIAHCLRTSGATREIFTPDAIREIALVSHGTPATINAICDRALVAGATRQAQTIGRDIVEACCVNLPEAQRSASRTPRNGVPPRGAGHRVLDTRARKRVAPRDDGPARRLARPLAGRTGLYVGLTAALILIPIIYSLYAGWFTRDNHSTSGASSEVANTTTTPPVPTADTAAPAITPASVATSTDAEPATPPIGAQSLLPEPGPRETVRPKPSISTQDGERPKSAPSSRAVEAKPTVRVVAPTAPSASSSGAAPTLGRSETSAPPRASREATRNEGPADRDSDASDPAGIIDWLLTHGKRLER